MTLFTRHGPWHFTCPACSWRDLRHHNTRKCPKCRADLVRGRKATAEEVAARDRALLAWINSDGDDGMEVPR